jgi:hypothetical protein
MLAPSKEPINVPNSCFILKVTKQTLRTRASDASISINAESTCVSATIQSQLCRYIEEVRSSADSNVLQSWSSRHSSYALLAPLAENLLTVPTSPAYVERIFSVFDLLTGGRRYRMSKNLEMRIFLKFNKSS